MRTPSGTLHVVDFKKSQIVSVIQPKDYWDDKRHWEIKNNIDTLEFRVFENTDHAATLVQQNLVLKEVRGGRIVPYVITEAEKDSDDKSLVVYASGEWIQLAKAEIIEPQKIESKTLKQCMEIALKGTKWEIGKTEHDGLHSITIDEFTNPLDLLKKIAASFELEIQYRAEVVGSQIVIRYVDMVKKRGRDTRKEVTVGKDLLGIKRIENSQNICTALLGYVKKDNGEFITISEINNGIPYLVDDAAYQRWNEKGKHKFAFYTPQTENEDMSPQRLMTLMKTEMNKLVNTSVSYEVEAQSIGRVFGLTHELINEGDTIRIIDTGFTPKLYLEARAIAGDESFKDPKQDKYMFGDYREIIDQNDELRRLYQKILSSLYDKVPQELFDQLKGKVTEQNKDIIVAKDKANQAQKESQEAKDLAEATVDYVKQNLVDIIEGVNPPTANLKPNKTLWLDISGGKPGILKIWTGTTWEPVFPDTGPLQQSIKDVQKDIETTKTELNKKVQDAHNQATGQFNEVKESLQSVSRTISDVQNEQGNINKKVTQIEQTSDGFKTSIESLTKKDGEISNKLNTVESTVEGTKKTISDVRQTIDEFTKKTTEIEKSVDGVKTTITNVQKDQGTMQSTLNQIKQTTDLNFQSITTISQTQGKHGEIIQQNTSDITQLNNQIKSKVSDTQMQDYVGGLGSVNMYFNSAFEDRVINTSTGVVTSRTPSLTKWVTRGVVTGTAVIPTSARNHDGYNSVQIQATGLTANNWAGVYQMIPVTAGQRKIVLSAWVLTNDKASLDAGAVLELKFLNGGTTVSQKSIDVRSIVTNGAWTFVSVTADVPTSAITQVQAGIMIVKNGLMWVSQPQVQQGANPTTFMENPKDYANYDQLIGEIAKKVATSDFNSKVTQMETTINQQSNRIDLKVEKTDVYTKVDADGRFGSKSIVDSHSTQLSLMSDEINLRVKSNEISSTINQTAQSVLIQANKIYLDGYIEAKHLKAQTLQGVTIQTAPQGSGANHIRLNAQNMTLYGSGQARGYFGFINRSDSNIQSALILGNDYASSGTLNGSLVLDQTTISGNQWTNSVASIGIATGRSGNDILKSSYINFYRYDGGMELKSQGEFKIVNDNGNVSLNANATGSTTGFIYLRANKDINLTALRGYINLYTTDNTSYPTIQIKDTVPTYGGDIDFIFANQIMMRISRNFINDGIKVMNGSGSSWANMKVGILRTMGNIGCDADIYAKNFINTSTRNVKTNIEDLPFSALKKVNSVRIKQYNLISDVEKYDAGEIDILPVNYGMIAEDTDDVFTTREKDAVSLYGSVSITMQAVQELDWKTDNMQCDMGMLEQELEAEKLEKVYMENQLSELKVLVNSQEDRIAKLEELLLQQLINKTPEQP
ncbi:phage tail spike protein [Bacillus albus]|uniref:phage tail spike protein n=1 Tax=Bacillus cereus group TaxID=86661 RepID=UPI0022E712D4|nr:phage tail spike protein [Bacillus cereus group sp. Bc177]MDA2320297.1 peptidase S74 [Bacillus cereus group sp. Bc177]